MSKFNKKLSIILIFALMVGVIAPLNSLAAGTPTIDVIGLYTPDAAEYVNGDVKKVPADLNKVTRLTTQKIVLQGNYFNFDPAQVGSFYYTISSVKPNSLGDLVEQTPVIYDKNAAVVTGSNTFEFRNVVLNEGLNKIVIYSVNGNTSSKAAWVYYNPALTITDLKVDQEPFKDGMIVPSDPNTNGTGIVISGLAPNADSVIINVLGDSTPYSGYFNSQTGYFQFKIDSLNSNKLADIKIDGGDQRFDIMATNGSQKMTLTRSFVYNDGTPFTFNNKVATMNQDLTTYGIPEDLITQPVINGTTNKVYLEGNIKVDFDPSNPSQLLYDSASIRVPYQSGSDKVSFDFNSLTAVPSSDSASADTTASIEEVSSTSTYKIFKYRIYNFDTNSAIREQSIITDFTSTLGVNFTKPTSSFDYIDTSKPYISQVKFANSNIAITDGTQVTELPIRVKLEASSASAPFTSVNVYYGNNIPLPHNKITNNEVEITWLPEGLNDITFVPVDASGVEQWTGRITRSIQYIPMQYIIVNNIYDGQIFDSFSLTQINGRFVNVPASNEVKAYVGDIPVALTRNADNTFTVDVAGKLVEGKNIITFKIVDQNNYIIAESIWEIYIFTTKAPELIMDIDASMADDFVTTSEIREGQFATRQKKVLFKGAFNETSTINIDVYRKDEFGNVKKEGTFTYPNFLDSKNFNDSSDQFLITRATPNGTTAEGNFELSVDLSNLGTTTIVVQATNSSGIISSRTYEITREPLPYEIVYPNLERTNVINSNYVTIEMVAEGADAVLFKDGAARKDWIIDKQGNTVEGFVYDVKNLRPGKNKIKFTVVRGDQKINAEIEVINANAPIEGASYKTKIDKRIKAFDGLVQLEFPKGTMLRRNDDSTINPYLSDQRDILFGIAEDTYGRVDKFRHPLASEKQKDYDDDGNVIDNHYPSISSQARIGQYYLTEPTGRFMEASPLIWVDAGTLRENASSKDDIIYGSGKLPYDREDIFYERNYSDQIVPTNRGKITIQYDKNFRADSWPYLTIYHFKYNPDRGMYEWQNIGGVVDTKKNTITAPIDSFGYFRVMYMNQSFDDVVGHNWARIDLDTLYSKGIMVNKYNDRFVPEENITRGEFVTLLVKAFELPLNYEGPGTFYDVFKNPRFSGNALYEYKYIETAARYGIVRGRLEGTFTPDEPISRQDAAVMIARAANLKTSSLTDEKQLTKTKQNLQKQFTDANIIDLYSMPSVEAVVKAGLMNGKPNVMLEGQKKPTYRFDPTYELKRSEAARIVINVMKQQKKIPK